MKKLINYFLQNPFFSGSLIMVFGSNIVNFLTYIYHLIIGRLLGPASYGELSALFSLIGLISIIPNSFGLVIIKTISASKTEEATKGLINWFSKRFFYLSLAMFFLVSLASINLAAFLNIDNPFLIVMVGAMFLFSLPTFLNRSVLQGLLNFKVMISSMIIENAFKLVLGAIFIYLGFAVFGAISAMFFSIIVAWFITRNALKSYQGVKKELSPKQKEIFNYALPVLINSFATTSLISADLILVKHFFPSSDAGIYAAVSTLGKIIFFGTAPISSVMFPLVSKKKSIGDDPNRIFIYSLIVTIIISIVVVIVYRFLPKLSVFILYGQAYFEAIKYLSHYGIFIALYTVASLFISYFLSINKTKIVIFPLTLAVIQILGIWFFHQSISQVIDVSIAVSSVLVAVLSIYYFIYLKKGHKS